MSRSTEKPQALWIRRKDGQMLTVRPRWNIQQVTVTEDDGTKRQEWDFSEHEVKVELPGTVRTRAEIRAWVREHLDGFISQAREAQARYEPPMKDWERKKQAEQAGQGLPGGLPGRQTGRQGSEPEPTLQRLREAIGG